MAMRLEVKWVSSQFLVLQLSHLKLQDQPSRAAIDITPAKLKRVKDGSHIKGPFRVGDRHAATALV